MLARTQNKCSVREVSEGRVVHLRIAARDPHRALAFYRACFSWVPTTTEAGELGFLTSGGLQGCFWTGGEPSSAGPELYLEVARIEAVIATAITLGGMRIARPTLGLEGGRVAHLLDCEGNRVCLWERPAGPAAKGSALPAPMGILVPKNSEG